VSVQRLPRLNNAHIIAVDDIDIAEMDQINQVLILLAVICNMIIGLSVVRTNFIVAIAVMCVQLGMSTIDSEGSSIPHPFSEFQNEIIANMPTSLADALKKFGIDSRFDMYAACPSCNFTNKARLLGGKEFYDYPEFCLNNIVGEAGMSKCGTGLLCRRRDGTLQPVKPYLVASLPDYLARCLADPTYLHQSTQAIDTALNAIRSGKESPAVENVFEADFIKDFRGPDGKLFVDRGEKIRLAFSIHLDFFNPNGITHRGAHESVGIISCTNLALNPSIRYLPENMYINIIPGPN